MFLLSAVVFWLAVHFLGLAYDFYLCLWLTLVLLYLVHYNEFLPWETIQRLDEIITFYPTLASFDGNNVIVSVHGCIYHPKATTRLRQAGISLLARTLRFDLSNQRERKFFLQRAGAFLVDNRRGKRVAIRFDRKQGDSGAWKISNLTQANGHFMEDLTIHRTYFEEDNSPRETSSAFYHRSGYPKTITFTSVPSGEQQKTFAGEALVLEDEGVSVISDIDDTIKISNVCHKKELMRNSFLRKFRVVPGMPELYRKWESELDAQFHFVSGSPWQLWGPLEKFFQRKGFPKASMHMRDFRFKDSSFFDMFSSPIHAKRRLIHPIMKRFPKRKFIFVGDTGEMDPEVYGELARQFPGQVKAIFIRRAAEKEELEAAGLKDPTSPNNKDLKASVLNLPPPKTPLQVTGEISEADARFLREEGIEEVREDDEEDVSESEDSESEKESKGEKEPTGVVEVVVVESKKVEGEELQQQQKLTPREARLERESKRWAVAFKDLEDKVLWKVFDTPEELASLDLKQLFN